MKVIEKKKAFIFLHFFNMQIFAADTANTHNSDYDYSCILFY